MKAGTPTLHSTSTQRHSFFARIDTSGNLLWIKQLAGGQVYATDVVIGANDTIYIVGHYRDSIDLDPSPSDFILHNPFPISYQYVFLAKYDDNGSFITGSEVRYQNSPSIIGSYDDAPSIAIGANNQLILAFSASPSGIMDFDLGPDSLWVDASTFGFQSVYIVSYSSNLKYQWHNTIHGAFTGPLELTGLSVNIDNHVHVLLKTPGSVEASSSHPGAEFTGQSGSGGNEVWLSFTPAGTYEWTNLVGDYWTGGYHTSDRFANDPVSGACFFIGRANGTLDLDRTAGIYNISSNGNYVARYTKDGHIEWAMSLNSPGTNTGTIVLQSLAVNEDNLALSGRFSGAADFNAGLKDSILTAPTGMQKGFIARYDNQGQFLSVLTLTSSGNFEMKRVFGLPVTKSFITIIDGISATTDLDPSPGTTRNVGLSTALASYHFDCVAARALSRDTFPSLYNYCRNENLDLYFPRQASGYSQMIWEADTGSGFFSLDSSSVHYQLVGENLRILNPGNSDTIAVRGSISNLCGSDTTDTLYLTLRRADLDTLQFYICGFDTIHIQGKPYYQSASFNDSLTNTAGCDSIINYQIDQVFPVSQILQDSTAMISAYSADAYQWLRCPGFTPVIGATDSIFYPADTASYALAISLNACTDTSSCIRSTIGLRELQPYLEIFPNPASDKLFIRSTTSGSYYLHDLRGHLLQTARFDAGKTVLNLEHLPQAVYLLEIFSGEEKLSHKRIIKR